MNDYDGKTILIVEDEPSIRLMVRMYFGRQGANVVECTTVEEARAHLGAVDPDIALVDKNLPGNSGLELLGELRRRSTKAVLVLMTAYPTKKCRREAHELGVTYFVPKPFSLIKLSESLLTGCDYIDEVYDIHLEPVT